MPLSISRSYLFLFKNCNIILYIERLTFFSLDLEKLKNLYIIFSFEFLDFVPLLHVLCKNCKLIQWNINWGNFIDFFPLIFLFNLAWDTGQFGFDCTDLDTHWSLVVSENPLSLLFIFIFPNLRSFRFSLDIPKVSTMQYCASSFITVGS